LTRPEERFTFAGPAASALALDTSRCLHYGSRVRGGYRVVVDLSFMSRFSVLEPHAYYGKLALGAMLE
jgi:hypothetical protein